GNMIHRSTPHFRHLALTTCVLLILSGLSGTMATAHAQTRAYVTNNSDHTVSVIDTATNTVITNIPIEGFPLEVAITPDGTRAYVTNSGVFDTGSVSVIDTATNTVIATILNVSFPFVVAFTPSGARAYVTGFDNNVFVVDTVTNTVIATIPVIFPRGVAVTPDGTRVYIAHDVLNIVSVIDTATNTVITTIPVGEGAFR